MASVHHCNGKELWVVTHGIDNSNFYFSLMAVWATLQNLQFNQLVRSTMFKEVLSSLPMERNWQYAVVRKFFMEENVHYWISIISIMSKDIFSIRFL